MRLSSWCVAMMMMWWWWWGEGRHQQCRCDTDTAAASTPTANANAVLRGAENGDAKQDDPREQMSWRHRHYLIDGMMSTIDGGASVGRFCGRPGGCRPPTDEEERVRSHWLTYTWRWDFGGKPESYFGGKPERSWQWTILLAAKQFIIPHLSKSLRLSDVQASIYYRATIMETTIGILLHICWSFTT